jgi:opacity protein-like surface antigen
LRLVEGDDTLIRIRLGMNVTRSALLGAVLTVGTALPAAAQNVSAGYQFQRIANDGLNLPAGFNVDASFPIGKSGLHALGQVDWSRKSESERIGGTTVEESTTLTTYGAGVRWGISSARASPFVQAVIGFMRASASCIIAGVDLCAEASEASETDLMLQVGGGVAVPFTLRMALVGQVDYRRIFSEGEAGNTFRVIGGIRLNLSK